MKQIVDTFKALGDRNRLRILLMLHIRPLCVCEIEEVLDIALSTVSQHLRTMRYTGLIKDRKEGRWVVYSLAEDDPALDTLLEGILSLLEGDDQIISDRKRVGEIDRDLCAVRALQRRKQNHPSVPDHHTP
jgi:ArsR family transcriptional regulator